MTAVSVRNTSQKRKSEVATVMVGEVSGMESSLGMWRGTRLVFIWRTSLINEKSIGAQGLPSVA